MVGIGTGCFMQLPGNSKQRVLHPVRVIGLVDETYTVEAQEDDLLVKPNMDVVLYFEQNREFMQQPGRIEAVDDAAGGGGSQSLISLKVTGTPVSAESRQDYRVSSVITGYRADVNAEKACQVLDVSRTGLSVVCTAGYTIGSLVDVSIVEDGNTHSGSACVQSVRDLGKGQTRYGLYCVDDRKSQGTLAEGLQQASMRLQRDQLRRLAGIV